MAFFKDTMKAQKEESTPSTYCLQELTCTDNAKNTYLIVAINKQDLPQSGEKLDLSRLQILVQKNEPLTVQDRTNAKHLFEKLFCNSEHFQP